MIPFVTFYAIIFEHQLSTTAPQVDRWPTEPQHLPMNRQRIVPQCPNLDCSQCRPSLHTLSTTGHIYSQ